MADMKIKFTNAQYEKLSRQLDEAENKSNNTLFKKIQRKVRSLYMNEERIEDLNEKERASQRVITGKHYSLLKRVRQMEGQM